MNSQQLQEYFSNDLEWGRDFQSRAVFDFLLGSAREAKGGVVLDAGAGYQRYRPFFEESLYLAQEHPVAGARNKDIRTFDILCDVRRIPLEDNSVDVVLSTSSLEHFEFPEQFFHEAFRVLKPGGSLWINVPFAYNEHEVPYDFQRPTRFGLLRWYEHAGFERVLVQPTSSSVYSSLYHTRYALSEDARHLNDVWWARCVARGVTRMTLWWLGVIERVFDRGPYADTTWPIGWVATGYKPGTRVMNDRRWTGATEFFHSHARCNKGAVLRDGVLRAG